MGTILQERVAPQCLERLSVRDREWKKRASWINSRPNAASNKMGRRQPQRKPVQPQCALPRQDNKNEKKQQQQQQRRKHNHSAPSAKRNTSQHRAHETTESHQVSPAKDKVEPEVEHHCSHREHKPTGIRGGRHTPSFPCYRSRNTSPVQLKGPSLRQDGGGLSVYRESDSDSDLSESEQPAPAQVPPPLDLRPEVIDPEDYTSQKPRGRSQGGYDFPDFLPPPFNSWNLSQLAVFYNVEGRSTPRPRPVGLLERYLDKLLQLEWHQIQTSQEEGGKPAASDVTPSCHKPAAAASSRLSSPKCILQCQRAFPLTFLSSLASHSALLSGCACTLCRIRYSTCSRSCCRSAYIYNHHFRLSPTLEHRVTVPLPKRSFSESRVHSSDRRAQRFSSPVRTNSHLRRMQASGNIRSQVQGASIKLQHTARDLSVGACRDQWGAKGDALGHRAGESRKRSGSEQRRGRSERQRGGSEIKRGISEYRRGGPEGRRAAELKEREIKPDAVAAIMDNLPGSKNSFGIRASREKQVEFVT